MKLKWRRRPIVAAAPLVMLLTAARLPVYVPPQLAMSDSQATKIGEHFTAKPGDTLLIAKVYDVDRVTLNGSYHASIDRFSQDFTAGTKLTSVVVPEKAQQLTGLKSRTYYCGDDLRARSKFAESMVGDMFSKWESVVRFCFADEDKDNTLDHMIIAGAKDKAQLRAVAIDPIPYQRDRIVPDDRKSEIHLVFAKLDPVSGVAKLELQLWRDGKREQFDYLATERMAGAIFMPKNQYPVFKANPKKLAYPLHFDDVMGASVGITSVDAAKQQAEFVINRPIGPALFKPVSIRYTYIFIYI